MKMHVFDITGSNRFWRYYLLLCLFYLFACLDKKYSFYTMNPLTMLQIERKKKLLLLSIWDWLCLRDWDICICSLIYHNRCKAFHGHKMRNIMSGLSSWNEWLIVWVIGNALFFILSGRCKELDFEVRETWICIQSLPRGLVFPILEWD